MFLNNLENADIIEFGKKLGAYAEPKFNKNRTEVEATLYFESLEKSVEFVLLDFNVKSRGLYASMLAGEVRRRWYEFMKEKFGEEYVEAYNKNNKKNYYEDKNLLDLSN